MTDIETIEAAASEIEDRAAWLKRRYLRLGRWISSAAKTDYDRLTGLVAALRAIAERMR